MMRKLVIVSHTEHQKDVDGNVKGWGPTINEINYLSHFWKEVVHVACLEKNVGVKGSSVAYSNQNTQFEPIPTFGGKKIWQKLDILWKMPLILWKVQQSLKGASHVQLRVPMGIGVFLIPYFAFRRKSKYVFWVKYANNWGARSIPRGYKLQRWFLKLNFAKCRVTINGFWPNQPKHCISFENPCLTERNLEDGRNIISQKSYNKPYELIFVGRIDSQKGVDIIVEFIKSIDSSEIGFFHIVGEGEMKNEFEEALIERKIEFCFYGSLQQEELFEILKKSHCILLPSKSEGFPKVLAEAMNFGCILIASNVGSIGHYIQNGEIGIILNQNDSKGLVEAWIHFMDMELNQTKKMILKANEIAQLFSFEKYLENLKTEIFHGH